MRQIFSDQATKDRCLHKIYYLVKHVSGKYVNYGRITTISQLYFLCPSHLVVALRPSLLPVPHFVPPLLHHLRRLLLLLLLRRLLLLLLLLPRSVVDDVRNSDLFFVEKKRQNNAETISSPLNGRLTSSSACSGLSSCGPLSPSTPRSSLAKVSWRT